MNNAKPGNKSLNDKSTNNLKFKIVNKTGMSPSKMIAKLQKNKEERKKTKNLDKKREKLDNIRRITKEIKDGVIDILKQTLDYIKSSYKVFNMLKRYIEVTGNPIKNNKTNIELMCISYINDFARTVDNLLLRSSEKQTDAFCILRYYSRCHV